MSPQDLSISTPQHRIMIWSTAVAIIATGVYLSYIQLLGGEWLSRCGI